MCVEMSSRNDCTSQERSHLQRLAEMAEADLDASEAMSNPPLLDDEVLEHEYILDTQQYKIYETTVMLKEYIDLGLPVSFVVASVGGVATMGFVIGSGSSGYLLPLHVGSIAVTQVI